MRVCVREREIFISWRTTRKPWVTFPIHTQNVWLSTSVILVCYPVSPTAFVKLMYKEKFLYNSPYTYTSEVAQNQGEKSFAIWIWFTQIVRVTSRQLLFCGFSILAIDKYYAFILSGSYSSCYKRHFKSIRSQHFNGNYKVYLSSYHPQKFIQYLGDTSLHYWNIYLLDNKKYIKVLWDSLIWTLNQTWTNFENVGQSKKAGYDGSAGLPSTCIIEKCKMYSTTTTTTELNSFTNTKCIVLDNFQTYTKC